MKWQALGQEKRGSGVGRGLQVEKIRKKAQIRLCPPSRWYPSW